MKRLCRRQAICPQQIRQVNRLPGVIAVIAAAAAAGREWPRASDETSTMPP
eukprot:m.152982 g.152982  ORF g.152982 m.152982 type:complete len:51 (-) comp17453_c0_seq1:353-505(-)